jgi:hypothetical protein
LCIDTLAHLKINQYSTELFVSYSAKNPIAQKIVTVGDKRSSLLVKKSFIGFG